MSEARKVEVRPATAGDMEAYYGHRNKQTAWVWAGLVDGEVVGIGGWSYVAGDPIAFLDLKDEARPYKVTIWRGIKRVLAEAQSRGVRLIAIRDEDELSSTRLLTRAGFRERGVYWQHDRP
jgi:FMN phosphatase YigB (HAD superfamily)